MKKNSFIYVCVIAIVFFGLSFLCWLTPAEEFSVTERRPLKQFPKLSVETVKKGRFMNEFEDYSLDQFPYRDTFRSVKAFTHMNILGQSDNSGIYVSEGSLGKLDFPLSEKAMGNAVKKIISIHDNYLKGTDTKVYYSIVPDKNYFLTKANEYPTNDYEEMFAYFKEHLSGMKYIDIAELLAAEDYYVTDTHWKQEAILPVANRLAEEMGVQLEVQYEQVTLDVPFYGVYYGQNGLSIQPDQITYLNCDAFKDLTVMNLETGNEMALYDVEKAAGRDPYEMFLGGSVSAITIDNPKASTDKELVVFRDSFGSSLMPLLVEGYQKITLLDLRYMHESMIGKLVDFEEQDVLFLHSTTVLNSENAFY